MGGAEDVAAEADKARSLAAAASQKARSKGKGKGKTKGGPKKRRRGGDASESEEDESQGEDEEGTTVHGRVSTRKKGPSAQRRVFDLFLPPPLLTDCRSVLAFRNPQPPVRLGHSSSVHSSRLISSRPSPSPLRPRTQRRPLAKASSSRVRSSTLTGRGGWRSLASSTSSSP